MHGEELVIESIQAREILDSRGNPTVEVDVLLNSGVAGRAAVPSEASTGAHEALTLGDGDKTRYLGTGVRKAIENVNEIIAPELEGMTIAEEIEIDQQLVLLDGTGDRPNLSTHKILGVTLACAKAAADIQKTSHFRYIGGASIMERYPSTIHLMNGGSNADHNLDFRESRIMPLRTQHFDRSCQNRARKESFLKVSLKEKGVPIAVGDEGGFAPKTDNPQNLLQMLELAGFMPGEYLRAAFNNTEVADRGQTSVLGRPAVTPRCSPEPTNPGNSPGLQKRYDGGGTLPNLLSSKPNLLLVEDDFITSQTLSRDLRDSFNVLQAFTVDDALKKLEQEPFKIVLLDLLMGDRSGLEILEKIKIDPKFKDVAVAVLTSLQNEEVRNYCLSLGATEYIEKPETSEKLLQTLNCMVYANERSREQQQVITNWTNAYTNFAHDVRGPLHMLQHYLSKIGSGLEGKNQKIIQSACTTMKFLMLTAEANIQLFGLEEGMTSKNDDMTEVDLVQIIEEMVEVYAYKIEDKKIKVVMKAPGSSLIVPLANKRLYYTAYHNCFKNAYEACPDSGTIELKLDEKGDKIIVSIENDGSVSLKMQQRFFEQFSSEKRYGTGLGTYQAKLAINMIGGDISMHSSIDDNKTTVTIVLPKG